MTASDCRPNLYKCPRCGDYGLEHLHSRSICYNCNYSSCGSEDPQVPDWALKFYAKFKKEEKEINNNESDLFYE